MSRYAEDVRYRTMYLPCGGVAEFDHSSGISYRCEMCNAVVGSVGQPTSCQQEAMKWEAYEAAGMWKWDYNTGESYATHLRTNCQ
jgi:hypothetical protein